jgi:hypothetical protein
LVVGIRVCGTLGAGSGETAWRLVVVMSPGRIAVAVDWYGR